MEGILQFIDGMIASISKMRTEVVIILQDVERQRQDIADQTNLLDASKETLKTREAEVKKIEDIVAFEKSAKELMAITQETKDKLDKEQTDYRAYVDSTQKEIIGSQARLNEENASLKKEWEAFRKAQEVFAKEKEDFKLKLAKSLVEHADKK
jgi:predicted RNA methylase